MNVILMNGGTPDHVGIIPHWLDEDDKRPAKEQLDERIKKEKGEKYV